MRCLNLCTVASHVCEEDGTDLLVCNVIKASELWSPDQQRFCGHHHKKASHLLSSNIPNQMYCLYRYILPIYIYVLIYLFMYLFSYLFICVFIVYLFMYVFIYLVINVFIYFLCIYFLLYLFTYLCMYLFIYIYHLYI